VYFQPVTQLEISATQIRKRLAAGGSARYLMPLAAIDIIEREGLYRDHEERRT
jgi:nicotinate-nucleotide adenylyltransferase